MQKDMSWRAAGKGLRKAGHAVLAMVVPSLCLLCGTPVAGYGGLCASCFGRVTFLGTMGCVRCGLPLTTEDVQKTISEGTISEGTCRRCCQAPPPFTAVRAALVYDQHSRDILLGFKHGDQTHAAPVLARWLWRVGRDLITADSLIVPVPLHRSRLFQRRYNQAALLAQALARIGGFTACPDALLRVRKTISQGSFDRHRERHPPSGNRWQNVLGAFALRPGVVVRGKPIILVDDVMTSGATVHECSRVLMEAGALSVVVLVVARALPSAQRFRRS